MKRLKLFPKGHKIRGTRLTPIGIVFVGEKYRYKCKCDCGKEVLADASSLTHGRQKSCGCLKAELTRQRSTTHGLSRTPEFYAAYNAFARCRNPNHESFKAYGGRGIKFLFKSIGEMTKWLLKHLPKPVTERRMLLDRIDNQGHYEPNNLRWATTRESARNKRNSRLVTIDGRTKTITEWAEEFGITTPGLAHRIENYPKKLWRHKGRISAGVIAKTQYEQD